MENGTFQNLQLSHLDFSDFEDNGTRAISPPPREHETVQFREVPRDLRRSSTIESLLSQNEDLQARLKVITRRMALTEDENRAFAKDLDDLKQNHANLSDQLLIWKEKEKVWKTRNQTLENDLLAIRAKLPTIEETQGLRDKVERYQRHQEKVRTTLKPYIRQLKEYAQGLHQQIQGLHQELAQKETALIQRDRAALAQTEELEQKIQFFEMNQNDLTSSFERERALLSHEIQSLQEANQALEGKAQNLDRQMERVDELENLTIALRRSKEEALGELTKKFEEQQLDLREHKKKNIEISLLNQELKEKVEITGRELSQVSMRAEALDEQMTSLRYMWSQKCEENEKLKLSLQALEKINLELSQKMNEARKQASES